MSKSRFIKLVILISLLILFGCSGLKSGFPRQELFRITVKSWETGHSEQGAGLLVRLFDISPEFESDSFIFRVSRNQYKEDFYNRFMVSPARMITHAVREDLYASPFFRSIQDGDPQDIPYRLRGEVLELYADIREQQAPKAVLTLRLFLEKQAKDGFSPVINRTYPSQAAVASLDPADFAKGWNQCLKQILSDFYSDFKNPETMK